MITGRSITELLLTIPAILIAITLHEYAHGYVAYRLGDPTAKASGRLSLNPIHHIDPIGGLMLLLVGFGWAKPVPVNNMYFKNPKKDMALVGLAGPAANIIVAFLVMLISKSLNLGVFNPFDQSIVGLVINYVVFINIGLAIFNMIPIPPLDGSKIFNSFLPDRIYYKVLYYERYVVIVLMILLFTGVLTPVLRLLLNVVFKTLISIVSVVT